VARHQKKLARVPTFPEQRSLSRVGQSKTGNLLDRSDPDLSIPQIEVLSIEHPTAGLAAVERGCGLPKETRRWERRYGFPRPAPARRAASSRRNRSKSGPVEALLGFGRRRDRAVSAEREKPVPIQPPPWPPQFGTFGRSARRAYRYVVLPNVRFTNNKHYLASEYRC